jgi:hypothetical protein
MHVDRPHRFRSRGNGQARIGRPETKIKMDSRFRGNDDISGVPYGTSEQVVIPAQAGIRFFRSLPEKAG